MFDDLFADYPDIQTIEEFNYRDIVDLPGGYEGVEIGDTIYKFVNRTSIDIYSESKRPVKESLDYCRCDVCGKREREDRFDLPPLAENRGDAEEHRAWLEFVREHINDFTDLGFRRMRYSMGFSFNPICERCCEKMYSNPKYKALWKEWCAYRDEAVKRADVPANESERKQKMKIKKIVKEGFGSAYDWQKIEDSLKFTLKFKDMEELNDFCSIIHQAGSYWDDASEWLDKLYSLMASDNGRLELEIRGKDELDTLYSLLRAGRLSDDDKSYIKWRNRLNDLYDEMAAQVEKFKKDKRFLKSSRRTAMKESTANNGSDHPRIYVGTYAKYNDGSIDGKWIDISEYNTYEEFVDACRELHADEEDPEFMVQDYENFPERWYHEGGLPTEEEFNKINDYYLMDDNLKRPFEVYVDYTGNDSTEDFEEAYEGQFDSPEDFGYYCVENFGIPDSAENYIDYEAYGRDLTEYWHQGDEDETDAEGEPEDPDYYYDNDGYKVMPYDSDREVGEQYIDDMGGVEQMGRDELARYFDYDGWGRDLLVNDYWEDEGYVFRNI